MTEKKNPWEGGPNITPEEEAEILEEIYSKRNKVKKQIEEKGYYRMDDDDDIIEVLEAAFDMSKKKT